MTIETPRLRIVPASPADDADDLLAVFNSNPEFLEASEAKRAYTRRDLEEYLAAEQARENGRCLAIRRRADGALVGTAALLVPHPDGRPWIGLLILRADEQGRGLGREAADALEDALAQEGWPEVRLAVLRRTERALGFWARAGYALVAERVDQRGNPCQVLEKRLAAPGSDGSRR